MAKLSARGREVLKQNKVGNWRYALCKTRGKFEILRAYSGGGYSIALKIKSEDPAVANQAYDRYLQISKEVP